MSRAAELASAERRRAIRQAGGWAGGVQNCQSGDRRNLRRRREDKKRRMDDAIEKLLLELADYTFTILRMARVRLRSARVAYSGKASMFRRDGAMTVRRFHHRPISNHEEQ